MKEAFDAKHLPLQLRIGDLTYIRLHREYKLKSKIHHKFGAQRCGPFKVVDTFPNAYRLALPPQWKIHDVISIEHLEPHPANDDLYGRDIASEIPKQLDDSADDPAIAVTARWQ